MLATLRGLRSLLALLAVLVWFIPCGFVVRFLVLPAAHFWPRRRFRLISAYMKGVTRGIFALLKAGGARIERVGSIPTDDPVLVIMNHQSLLDIQQITMMGTPYVPAFVTRARYARFIPLISPSIRLLGCPVVDPRREAKAGVEVVRRAATTLPHGILVFPEGHRTKDGEIQAFHTAGLRVLLGARRLPVYLAVTDGFWEARAFVDVAFKIHRIRGRTEVMGPFEPPAAAAEIPAFVGQMRDRMVERLREMRAVGRSAPEARPVFTGSPEGRS